jgi:hypothetical protein
VLVAACSSEAVDTTGPDLTPAFGVVADFGDASALESTTYFVVAAGQSLPARFEESVTELGASVEAVYPDLGVALVSAFGDGAARQLARIQGIAFAEPEPMFTLDEPVSVSEPEAVAGGVASADDPTLASRYARQWNMRAIHGTGEESRS